MKLRKRIPELEYSNSLKVEEFKLRRLQASLDYLSKNSPFYKRIFEKHNVDIYEVKELKDLQFIPTSSKQDLAAFNSDFLCVPNEKIVEWTTTSGTLGKAVSFGLTKSDLERLAENEARSLEIAECKPTDRVQLMVTLDKRFMAGLAYYLGAQLYGCSTVRVGSGSPGLQIDSIQRFKSNVLITVPSFLLKVLEYGIERNIPVARLGIEKLICIGEPLRNSDFSLNNLGRRIQHLLPAAKLISTYASTEMSTAITECSEACGGHIPSDLIFIETVDENGQAVPKGSPGEVTVSTLGVEGMPVLRYRTGDICILHEDSCRCGNYSKRLSPVLGRKNQMIKFKGTTIYPEAVYEVLNGFYWVEAYVLLLVNDKFGVDQLSVSLATVDSMDEQTMRQELNDVFESKLRVKPVIFFKSKEDVQKLKFPDGSRKPIKIIDSRN